MVRTGPAFSCFSSLSHTLLCLLTGLLHQLAQFRYRKRIGAAEINHPLFFPLQLGGNSRDRACNLRWNRHHAVPIAVQQGSGTNLHAAYRDWTANIEDVSVGV